eukprot:125090_1
MLSSKISDDAIDDNKITVHHGEYANSYAKKAISTKQYDRYEKIYNLIKYCLLNGIKMNVLNVGSGAADVVKEFVHHMMPYCNKLILNEINGIFCEQYRNSEWYRQHKSKIHILEGDIESILINQHKNILNNISVDLIWCNHMIYHIRLNRMSWLIDELSNILTSNPQSGYIFVSCLNETEPFITAFHKHIVPNYQLCSHIDNILKEKNAKFTQIIDENSFEFNNKNEAFNLFKLFVIGDIYSNPDYKPSLPLSKDENIILTAFIKSHLDSLLVKKKDKYIWTIKGTFFILRKINSYSSKL